MSRGQLTYYFPKKEAILIAVFDRMLRRMIAQIMQTADPKPGTGQAWDCVRHMLAHRLEAFAQGGRNDFAYTADLEISVEVTIRKETGYSPQAKKVVEGLASGEVDCVIGTHRLLTDKVKFKDLGLLVIDEEQRFGVNHKELIKKLKVNVDVLTMSATPIPRTLELSLVGIRDLSLLQTPPAERQPILTYVGEYDDRVVAEAIRRELLREGQVFFVHPGSRGRASRS